MFRTVSGGSLSASPPTSLKRRIRRSFRRKGRRYPPRRIMNAQPNQRRRSNSCPDFDARENDDDYDSWGSSSAESDDESSTESSEEASLPISRKEKQLARQSLRQSRRREDEQKRNMEENKISMDDYLRKQSQFKLWLSEEQKKEVKDLTSPKRKTYFKMFVRLWNKRHLPTKFYESRVSQHMDEETVHQQQAPATTTTIAAEQQQPPTPTPLPDLSARPRFSLLQNSPALDPSIFPHTVDLSDNSIVMATPSPFSITPARKTGAGAGSPFSTFSKATPLSTFRFSGNGGKGGGGGGGGKKDDGGEKDVFRFGQPSNKENVKYFSLPVNTKATEIQAYRTATISPFKKLSNSVERSLDRTSVRWSPRGHPKVNPVDIPKCPSPFRRSFSQDSPVTEGAKKQMTKQAQAAQKAGASAKNVSVLPTLSQNYSQVKDCLKDSSPRNASPGYAELPFFFGEVKPTGSPAGGDTGPVCMEVDPSHSQKKGFRRRSRSVGESPVYATPLKTPGYRGWDEKMDERGAKEMSKSPPPPPLPPKLFDPHVEGLGIPFSAPDSRLSSTTTVDSVDGKQKVHDADKSKTDDEEKKSGKKLFKGKLPWFGKKLSRRRSRSMEVLSPRKPPLEPESASPFPLVELERSPTFGRRVFTRPPQSQKQLQFASEMQAEKKVVKENVSVAEAAVSEKQAVGPKNENKEKIANPQKEMKHDNAQAPSSSQSITGKKKFNFELTEYASSPMRPGGSVSSSKPPSVSSFGSPLANSTALANNASNNGSSFKTSATSFTENTFTTTHSSVSSFPASDFATTDSLTASTSGFSSFKMAALVSASPFQRARSIRRRSRSLEQLSTISNNASPFRSPRLGTRSPLAGQEKNFDVNQEMAFEMKQRLMSRAAEKNDDSVFADPLVTAVAGQSSTSDLPSAGKSAYAASSFGENNQGMGDKRYAENTTGYRASEEETSYKAAEQKATEISYKAAEQKATETGYKAAEQKANDAGYKDYEQVKTDVRSELSSLVRKIQHLSQTALTSDTDTTLDESTDMDVDDQDPSPPKLDQAKVLQVLRGVGSVKNSGTTSGKIAMMTPPPKYETVFSNSKEVLQSNETGQSSRFDVNTNSHAEKNAHKAPTMSRRVSGHAEVVRLPVVSREFATVTTISAPKPVTSGVCEPLTASWVSPYKTRRPRHRRSRSVGEMSPGFTDFSFGSPVGGEDTLLQEIMQVLDNKEEGETDIKSDDKMDSSSQQERMTQPLLTEAELVVREIPATREPRPLPPIPPGKSKEKTSSEKNRDENGAENNSRVENNSGPDKRESDFWPAPPEPLSEEFLTETSALQDGGLISLPQEREQQPAPESSQKLKRNQEPEKPKPQEHTLLSEQDKDPKSLTKKPPPPVMPKQQPPVQQPNQGQAKPEVKSKSKESPKQAPPSVKNILQKFGGSFRLGQKNRRRSRSVGDLTAAEDPEEAASEKVGKFASIRAFWDRQRAKSKAEKEKAEQPDVGVTLQRKPSTMRRLQEQLWGKKSGSQIVKDENETETSPATSPTVKPTSQAGPTQGETGSHTPSSISKTEETGTPVYKSPFVTIRRRSSRKKTTDSPCLPSNEETNAVSSPVNNKLQSSIMSGTLHISQPIHPTTSVENSAKKSSTAELLSTAKNSAMAAQSPSAAKNNLPPLSPTQKNSPSLPPPKVLPKPVFNPLSPLKKLQGGQNFTDGISQSSTEVKTEEPATFSPVANRTRKRRSQEADLSSPVPEKFSVNASLGQFSSPAPEKFSVNSTPGQFSSPVPEKFSVPAVSSVPSQFSPMGFTSMYASPQQFGLSRNISHPQPVESSQNVATVSSLQPRMSPLNSCGQEENADAMMETSTRPAKRLSSEASESTDITPVKRSNSNLNMNDSKSNSNGNDSHTDPNKPESTASQTSQQNKGKEAAEEIKRIGNKIVQASRKPSGGETTEPSVTTRRSSIKEVKIPAETFSHSPHNPAIKEKIQARVATPGRRSSTKRSSITRAESAKSAPATRTDSIKSTSVVRTDSTRTGRREVLRNESGRIGTTESPVTRIRATATATSRVVRTDSSRSAHDAASSRVARRESGRGAAESGRETPRGEHGKSTHTPVSRVASVSGKMANSLNNSRDNAANSGVMRTSSNRRAGTVNTEHDKTRNVNSSHRQDFPEAGKNVAVVPPMRNRAQSKVKETSSVSDNSAGSLQHTTSSKPEETENATPVKRNQSARERHHHPRTPNSGVANIVKRFNSLRDDSPSVRSKRRSSGATGLTPRAKRQSGGQSHTPKRASGVGGSTPKRTSGVGGSTPKRRSSGVGVLTPLKHSTASGRAVRRESSRRESLRLKRNDSNRTRRDDDTGSARIGRLKQSPSFKRIQRRLGVKEENSREEEMEVDSFSEDICPSPLPPPPASHSRSDQKHGHLSTLV